MRARSEAGGNQAFGGKDGVGAIDGDFSGADLAGANVLRGAVERVIEFALPARRARVFRGRCGDRGQGVGRRSDRLASAVRMLGPSNAAPRQRKQEYSGERDRRVAQQPI